MLCGESTPRALLCTPRGPAGHRRQSASAASSPAVALAPPSLPCSLHRRQLLLALLSLPLFPCAAQAAAPSELSFDELEAFAKAAYRQRELPDALAALSELVRREPDVAVWRERRGQVLLDLKQFDAALADFDAAERAQGAGFVSLGLLANRALAYEGLSRWEEAIQNYSRSLELAAGLGFEQPYVLNSRGNCKGSLGDWEGALADYQQSSSVMRQMRNLSGAVYADGNAALAEVQLGRPEARKHLEAVARRAAGSTDMRLALASLDYAEGNVEEAERQYEFACRAINSGEIIPGGPVVDGCGQYRDAEWVRVVRRWPPVLAGMLERFLALR